MARYLRAHPGYLADNPGLYAVLAPPRRVHGPGLADHMEAMLLDARQRAEAAERDGARAAADRRAADGFARRVQDAVLALMRAPDPAWLAANELAVLLQLDSARICVETPDPRLGAAVVPRGTVAGTLGQRVALVRAAIPDSVLHGEAVALAAREALVRLPVTAGPALLALACRTPEALEGATTDALAFLGRAVAAALEQPIP